MIYDAQYTPDEQHDFYKGWGHSSWKHATEAAVLAETKQLILPSHDPGRTDAEVDAILELARGEFSNTTAAYEGLTIELT